MSRGASSRRSSAPAATPPQQSFASLCKTLPIDNGRKTGGHSPSRSHHRNCDGYDSRRQSEEQHKFPRSAIDQEFHSYERTNRNAGHHHRSQSDESLQGDLRRRKGNNLHRELRHTSHRGRAYRSKDGENCDHDSGRDGVKFGGIYGDAVRRKTRRRYTCGVPHLSRFVRKVGATNFTSDGRSRL
jgi:hypothetical protein